MLEQEMDAARIEVITAALLQRARHADPCWGIGRRLCHCEECHLVTLVRYQRAAMFLPEHANELMVAMTDTYSRVFTCPNCKRWRFAIPGVIVEIVDCWFKD